TSLIEDRVQPTLLSVPGVADTNLYGNQERTLNIIVDPARLASHRLAVDDVADALESASLDVPAGSVESHEQNLLIRADATVVRESLIERIMIDATARIGDVASVFYGPAEATSYVRLNGRPVMGLSVVRQPQSNTIEISDGVDRAVERLNAQLHDLEIVKVSDDAVFIRGAVNEVLLTLLFAIAVVILVIMIFMGSPRITVIPAVTIPVALVGSVAAIWLLGFSVNVLTLLALVLAAGLVVDDAIVVLENVERVKRQGAKPLAAAVLGTRQVFFAVIATTVTLASVFVPIAFLPGQAGMLFREFGFTLAISVVISSFVALSLCPMMSARLGTSGSRPGPLRRALAGAGNRIVSAYERSLAALMQAPVLTIGVALALVGGVATLFQSLDQELVPSEDRGAIIIGLQGPDGVNLRYSDRQVAQVEEMLQPLRESGEVENIFAIIGRWDLHRGYVTAPLAPWGERRRQQEIAAELTPALNDIPGARASVYNPNSLSIRSGGGSEIEFAITGAQYDVIAEATDEFMDAV
ncbi:MAG TPA: efflux RND transporter permease subunit, partial [Arenicellales bacterium]|nr:efflux RND transporter permease subunit [Arenicellales bacterium]